MTYLRLSQIPVRGLTSQISLLSLPPTARLRRPNHATVLVAHSKGASPPAPFSVAPSRSPRPLPRRALPVAAALRIDRSRLQRAPPPKPHSDEELEEVCPTECVREIRTQEDLAFVLDYAARHGPSLVVVDFYKTACGSCKYIERGFAKLCRAEGEVGDPVIFLKHNVMDEYEEEMSDLADSLRIKAVPLFHFYLGEQLVDKFATRDKSRILETIQKYIPGFQAEEEAGSGAEGAEA